MVSLVPSITESLAATRPAALVGATDWCTHPPDLDVSRVRGTKNPDVRAIVELRPDLVVTNKEENRELDVRRLRDAGVAVWVTDIRSLDQAFSSLERLFDVALDWGTPAWLEQARAVWAAPPRLPPLQTAVAIWRDPWMVVGGDTFTDDLLSRLGVRNAFRDSVDRYPAVAVEELDGRGLDVILLPDEPYVFTAADGPEALPRTPTALVSGRMLTWYGPSLEQARDHLERCLSR